MAGRRLSSHREELLVIFVCRSRAFDCAAPAGRLTISTRGAASVPSGRIRKSMFKELPSMTSLRAFEAAARHLSFTKAAVELGMTQGAISQQIKNLEDLIGLDL